MSQKSSCFAAAWDLAPCPHSQCLFCYVLLMPTKFSCLAAAWDLAPCPHFHYLPNDLLHHQAGDRKGKVSNFRWLRDRKIGSGILSSSVILSSSDPGWGLAFMPIIQSNQPKPSASAASSFIEVKYCFCSAFYLTILGKKYASCKRYTFWVKSMHLVKGIHAMNFSWALVKFVITCFYCVFHRVTLWQDDRMTE